MVENDPWLPVMGKETGTLVKVPVSFRKAWSYFIV